MEQKISFKKYLLICALGFGLGGFLWGLVLYQGIPNVQFPFHFMAIIIMGLLGGISLVWFSRDIREYSKSVLAGFLGWGIGFIVGGIISYPLYFIGIYFSSIFLKYFISAEKLNTILNLQPNISVGDFWLIFLLIGAIIGLFYSLILKTKKWALIWRVGVGLALGSIIGPILGNLIGNLFNSLLISYLITFILIGVISGLFLSWGIYKYKK